MLSLHAYLIYFGIYALAVAVPGPGNLAIAARALGQGFRATVPAVMGNTLGDLTLMTLSALGLALVAKTLGGLFLAVKLAGAAYLVYLGYKYWTASTSADDVVPADARRGFLAQYALTLGNPKAIAFFVALLPTVVDLKALGTIGYLELCSETLIVLPAIMLSYAALAAQARILLTSERARRRMNKSAAVIMTGAGIVVAVS